MCVHAYLAQTVIEGDDEQLRYDRLSWRAWLGSYLLFNLLFFANAKRVRTQRKKQLRLGAECEGFQIFRVRDQNEDARKQWTRTPREMRLKKYADNQRRSLANQP